KGGTSIPRHICAGCRSLLRRLDDRRSAGAVAIDATSMPAALRASSLRKAGRPFPATFARGADLAAGTVANGLPPDEPTPACRGPPDPAQLPAAPRPAAARFRGPIDEPARQPRTDSPQGLRRTRLPRLLDVRGARSRPPLRRRWAQTRAAAH